MKGTNKKKTFQNKNTKETSRRKITPNEHSLYERAKTKQAVPETVKIEQKLGLGL